MSSPVERLEAWCDKEERRVRLDGHMAETAMTDRELTELDRITAYRAIVADYKAWRSEARHWDPAVSATWEREYDALDRVVEKLADAVNSEVTPDA